jgi:hypothetical protein
VNAVDDYLAALRRELRGDPFFRRRVLAEVEDHLRESAAEHGDEEALARFGAPRDVAQGFATRASERAALVPALAVLLAASAFVLAYGATENLLPPAPWPSAAEAPSSIRGTIAGAEIALAAAVLAALAAVAIRRARLVLATLACASATLAGVLAVAGAWAFFAAYEALDVPGRPGAASVAFGSLSLLAVVGGAVAGLVWATAQRASRSYGLLR